MRKCQKQIERIAVLKSQIYQFKITLQHISPPIWRRIQIHADGSFWDLHIAIQDSMGWWDYHLHSFAITGKKQDEMINIGLPDPNGFDIRKILPCWLTPLSRFFKKKDDHAQYLYDFGDDWNHDIILEEILPAEKGMEYPICLDGERACPHEDCGGPPGYEHMLKVIADPDHDEYDRMMNWLGGEYYPELFLPDDVHFDNPLERLKDALML